MSRISLGRYMGDGRRVFKSKDGVTVIDEFGEVVPAEVIDPDLIPDGRPTAEEFLPVLEETQRLEAERDQLLERQGRIDAARKDLSEGALTGGDLDALEAEFGPIEAPPATADLDARADNQPPSPMNHAPAYTP